MADGVDVDPAPDGTFRVEVRRGPATTHHVVTVSPDLLARLDDPDLEPELLVRLSFEFLLEREPPDDIQRRFDLNDISRYFPEYPDDLTWRLP